MPNVYQAASSPTSGLHLHLPTASYSTCFICLDGEAIGPLVVCCGCTARPVHVRCMARWQLQAAGKMEEETCRFCMQQLPDWRSSLTPVALKPVAPMMAINFEGRTYKLRVRPGPEGLRHFKEQARNLLGVDVTEQYEVSFE
ncbi:zygote specific protein [Haematococcus lacustris]